MSQLPSFQVGDLFCLANDDGIDYPIGCVGTNGGPYNFGSYALGYFEAGTRLMRDVHRDRTYLDLLVYPLCFLYRHGIELSIKHLLRIVPLLFCENCNPDLDHSLLKNWNRLRGFLVRQRQKYPEEPLISEETLGWIDTVLQEFVSVDPNSLVFRYPEAKDEKPPLQEKTHVNFPQLGKFMEPLGRWFEEMIGVTGQLLYEAA